MTPLEQQFQVVSERHATATLTPLPTGAALIVVPNFPLPVGWAHPSTEVRFVAPAGYPLAKPDCFWTSHGLRLEGGRMPQNVGEQAIPGVPGAYLWFSWHTQSWDPSRDTLLTYLRVIAGRFQELR